MAKTRSFLENKQRKNKSLSKSGEKAFYPQILNGRAAYLALRKVGSSNVGYHFPVSSPILKDMSERKKDRRGGIAVLELAISLGKVFV